MTLDRGAEGLVIERRWYTPSAWGMVLFCALWDGFLIVWYSMALASDEAPLMMLVFPLLHVAVGVGLLYYVLALFCNRTWISASRGRLEIRHGPVPWPGSCELEASSIQQLFCKERFHRSKHGGHHTYALHAIVRGQGKRQLVSGLSDPDDAIFLEQQLESHLGIEDRKVSDELRR